MAYVAFETEEDQSAYWRLMSSLLGEDEGDSTTGERGFCPTGEGGGIDNSCGTKGGGGKGGNRRKGSGRASIRKPSSAEKSLAASKGSSKAQVKARKVVAAHFMASQGSYFDRKTGELKPLDSKRLRGQMKAVDWTKPVTAGPPPGMPPPQEFVQWQTPGLIPPAGGYFSTPGTEPERLGIGRRGTLWTDPALPTLDKVPHVFEVSGSTQYLRSTAAPARDDWSQKGAVQIASGGGPQWFIPEAQAKGGVKQLKLKGARPRRAARAFCPGASPPDNSCSPANKGDGTEDGGGARPNLSFPSSWTGVEKLNSLRPESTSYDPKSLINAGPPSGYEGGELREGQTLWDRYDLGSPFYLGGKYDPEVNPVAGVSSVFTDPYTESSKAMREQLESSMPLRVQQAELRAIARDAANALDREQRSAVARTAYAFSSSVTNEAMSLMSHISPSPEVQAKRDEQIALLKRVSPDEELPSQSDVDLLSRLARTTELPEGVTLFHGIKGVEARSRLDQLSQSRGAITLSKITSTSTRPAIATQFGRTTARGAGDQAGPGDFTEGGEFVHKNGTLASVVRIRDASRGFPISGTSVYRDEAEVLVGPGTVLRFTGESRTVFIPAANDSGWPSGTFSTSSAKSKQGGARTRILWPVTVYDAVMERD